MGEYVLKAKRKRKYVTRTAEEVNKWLFASNFFIKSKIPGRSAVKEFNQLDADIIKVIQQRLKEYDDIRRAKLHGKEDIPLWEGSIISDAHILAYENGIDPLVVMMCICPIVKLNEAILVK